MDMYAKYERAQKVFESILIKNVVNWIALIDGYVKNGLGNNAISCLQYIRPNAMTYACVLKAFKLVRNIEVGGYEHSVVR